MQRTFWAYLNSATGYVAPILYKRREAAQAAVDIRACRQLIELQVAERIAEADIPSIIERGADGEALSVAEKAAWSGYELGFMDGYNTKAAVQTDEINTALRQVVADFDAAIVAAGWKTSALLRPSMIALTSVLLRVILMKPDNQRGGNNAKDHNQ